MYILQIGPVGLSAHVRHDHSTDHGVTYALCCVSRQTSHEASSSVLGCLCAYPWGLFHVEGVQVQQTCVRVARGVRVLRVRFRVLFVIASPPFIAFVAPSSMYRPIGACQSFHVIRAEEHRRIATWYEKLASSFLAVVKLAFMRRHLPKLFPDKP